MEAAFTACLPASVCVSACPSVCAYLCVCAHLSVWDHHGLGVVDIHRHCRGLGGRSEAGRSVSSAVGKGVR